MISIAIVAHTTRTNQATNLAHTTSAQHISLDDGTLGCDNNHKTVLRWHHNQPHQPDDWCVVLEDDAQPIDDFPAQLAAALAVAPTPVVNLYLGTSYPPHHQRLIKKSIAEAQRTNSHWTIRNLFIHTVGYAIRYDVLASLAGYETVLPIDQHIDQWARFNNHLTCFTHPSLVDHMDGPSLIHHRDGLPRNKPRHAWVTGGHEEWTAASIDVHHNIGVNA